MSPTKAENASVAERAAARVAEAARMMGTSLTEVAGSMQAELADSIPELRGDPTILELLRASVEANVETFLHFAQYSISIEDITAPAAAVAYAQRLAQRSTSSNALLRAYRLGQRRIVDLAFEEIAREELDLEVAFKAAQMVHELTFTYVDKVAEKVAAEYESERERWLANWNTVRANMLTTVLTGQVVDMAAAEGALNYRLRQNHLGIVAWDTARESSTSALQEVEALVALIGEAIGSVGRPLFIPQDRSLGWGWIPLGRTATEIALPAIRDVLSGENGQFRVALGSIGAALPGFRSTHAGAVRAQTVASLSGESAADVTTYDEPGVRTAALLARDLSATRDLVSSVLGGLAGPDESSQRLRETLFAFLSEGGSYQSTADRIHVHKNTVKYRLDRAIEIRAYPLEHDRFNLELALVACHWLGQSVLPSQEPVVEDVAGPARRRTAPRRA